MKVNKLTPNFEVKDIRKTVEFYQSVLGFTLVMAVPETQDGIEQSFADGKEYVYALVSKDNVEMMFQRTESFKRDVFFAKDLSISASVSFYMEIEGVDSFYEHIKSEGLNPTELKTAWYGMREFYLTDNNGYILGFAEKSAE
ncbi:VOC family protein [Flavivirga eckloniae]|uniref:Bleomycin resistance family protein n=1 Tax=Flavivirga eckloniae TaxID=1803846 RepID=A0A2K9PQC1_9FLAO|nr:VOC family protein [Flavivirga eckloniae]AUP79261.1 bleomycin resistance family protein [Flavivirga eckloniae]